ncbi:unnamed protein product [Acanthoscelides obtectus]|uniref:Uncharacterized protein n=1 Tax=Acanthoscelides obtectus TaxID=200917 RepID=A0A9P0LN78_ACAOB|nr:unnamed protein product [Acanthoscelides obtectus]CAK1628707.1 hypothetical protein AOBTE_LOCUS5356 [Acanthoscelides obtectus]
MKAVFEEKKRKSPEKEKKTKKNKEDYNKENCAEGKCNKAKLTTDREVKSKKTTTRNKRAKRLKNICLIVMMKIHLMIKLTNAQFATTSQNSQKRKLYVQLV